MPRTDTLEIGSLDAKVNLQTPTGTSGDGYETVAYEIPAQIRMASGGERLAFGSQVSVNSMVITMRHRTDLRSDMRIVWPRDGRMFQVLNYGDEVGDRQWVTVYASELLQ